MQESPSREPLIVNDTHPADPPHENSIAFRLIAIRKDLESLAAWCAKDSSYDAAKLLLEAADKVCDAHRDFPIESEHVSMPDAAGEVSDL